jgi:hypothetical protein
MFNCVLGNGMSFDENHRCNLPITKNYCEGLVVFEERGGWAVLENDEGRLVLTIETKTIIFAGSHRMIFKRDVQNKLLKLELQSDSLYVVCRKGLCDYDRNQDLINEHIDIK